jgi:NTE family protein
VLEPSTTSACALPCADTLASEAYDASFAVIVRTALGPIIFVGGAVGDNAHRKWWFGLGRVF